jgi:hypothetical protein
VHHCWALGPINHHELEEVRRPIRAEDQVASGIISDRFDESGITKGVLDVLRVDAVAESRPEDLQESIVLQNRLTDRWFARRPRRRRRPPVSDLWSERPAMGVCDANPQSARN